MVHEKSRQDDIESSLVETKSRTLSVTVTTISNTKLYIKPRVKTMGKCILALK